MFKGISYDQLNKARFINFDGYQRLARFVGSQSLDVQAVLIACERHRAAQSLGTRIIDRRKR